MMKEDILFYAFRYALGRMTYAVQDVSDEILHYATEISPKVRGIILREIDEAYKQNRLGMPMDAERWMKVRERLDELERKEKKP